MRFLATTGGSCSVFMAADLAGHHVSIVDVLICCAAFIASFLVSEAYDAVFP